MDERAPLYCVPLPGLTPWAKRLVHSDVAASLRAAGVASPSKSKRDRDDERDDEDGSSPRVAKTGDTSADAESVAVSASFPLQQETDIPCIVYVSGFILVVYCTVPRHPGCIRGIDVSCRCMGAALAV
jgi:Mini-chromosome maintenance replisome factor